eukprot:CAMPEP_0202907264 /NCGR_PEP_ID=MMETSP1392-20130828/41872_1 /ASSEMBLY_ACC=CAM_ASM_000868 /TAXON_ID=225041 /ORGANISM="Chlamydomonas chlamydogama, Strain SAG 11-48b" /LENGTH=233 /DNA_ID=CAMNT_0049596081 /DNA_START=220 /DNA_END=917 /DNA_ORIENTATION=-
MLASAIHIAPQETRLVYNENEFFRAVLNDEVTQIRLMSPLSLGSEGSPWVAQITPATLNRSLTIEGPAERRHTFVDFFWLSARLLVLPGKTLTFRHMEFANLQQISFQLGMDFVAKSPNATVVFNDVVRTFYYCAPGNTAVAYLRDFSKRPDGRPQQLALVDTPWCSYGQYGGGCWGPVLKITDYETIDPSGLFLYRAINSLAACKYFYELSCLVDVKCTEAKLALVKPPPPA